MPDISMCSGDGCPIKEKCYRHMATPKIRCDYLSQLHEAKAENAALTAEVERLKEGIQEIKDDCVCENIHSRPHELTAIKCGVLSKAFALLAKPEEKQ